MALSNWGTMALTPDGVNDGSYEIGGHTISLYKNWVEIKSLVADEKVRPEIILNDGSFNLLNEVDKINLDVRCWRGKQSSVNVLAYTRRYGMIGEKPATNFFIGIGCYGFTQKGTWVGVTKLLLRDFKAKMDRMIKAHELPEEFGDIDLTGATQLNQGDKFFANHVGRGTLGIMNTIGTKPPVPLMVRAFGGKPKRAKENVAP